LVFGLPLIALAHVVHAPPGPDGGKMRSDNRWTATLFVAVFLPSYGVLLAILYSLAQLRKPHRSRQARRDFARSVARMTLASIAAGVVYGILATFWWPQGRADNFALHLGVEVCAIVIFCLMTLLATRASTSQARRAIVVVLICLSALAGLTSRNAIARSCAWPLRPASALCTRGARPPWMWPVVAVYLAGGGVLVATLPVIAGWRSFSSDEGAHSATTTEEKSEKELGGGL
jgi:hypothetical protein